MNNETYYRCSQPDDYHITMRFVIAVVLGISLSIACIIFNCFVFAVFVTNPQHRSSPNLYMLLLALFDVFMGILYIAVISTKVLFLWIPSLALRNIWVSYVVPMLTLSHIVMTSSTFLILFAAIERYCTSVDNWALPHLQKHRKIFAAIAVWCGIFGKGSMILEMEAVSDPDCIGLFNERTVGPGILAHYEWYRTWFKFYFRQTFTIILPFFLLLYLNARLIYRLQQQRRIAKKIEHFEEKEAVKQKKARILAVTRTLVIIVCTYLMSNLLLVIITIWEFIDYDHLFNNFMALHVLSNDWISLFTLIACCLRLPIYAVVQPVLRTEMKSFIAQIWTEEKITRRMTLIENLQLSLPQTMLLQRQDSDVIEFV